MRIGITGSSGLIGTALRKTLKNKKISYAVMNRKKHNFNKTSSLKSFVSGKNIIIHLAGVSRKEKVSEIKKVNVLFTQNLLKAIELYNPGVKFIFASSVQADNFNDAYSKSKKDAEILVEKYSKKKIIKPVILRISNVYGKGAKPFYNSVLNTFAYQIKKNQTISINGDGTQKRDFINVKDVVSAIERVVSPEFRNYGTFGVHSGKDYSINQILKFFKKIIERDFQVEYKNTKSIAENFSTKKLKQLPGWKPSVNIETGLKELLE